MSPLRRPALLSAAARAGSRAVAASLYAGKAAGNYADGNYADGGQILQGPKLAESPQPPQIPPAQPSGSDQPLPINLATALYLSNARPLVIASARASVEEAAAQLQNAKVLWLPDLNAGTGYYRHDGTDQSTDGTIILDDKQAFAAGGGVTLNFGVTDAIFKPLAARQVLAAREWDLQTARNDAMLAVPQAYFDVQQAHGNLAGVPGYGGQGRSAGPQDCGTCPIAGPGSRSGAGQEHCCTTCGRNLSIEARAIGASPAAASPRSFA